MIAPRQSHASAALLEHYRGVAASTLGHFGDEGYLRGIRPLFDGLRMLGNVVTARVFAPDGSILRDALLLAEPGDVLVIECLGDPDCACWGELRTLAGLIKGLAGVVVEGAVTDVAALREHRLPVFSRGVSAFTTRGIGQQGEVNRPIEVAGVRVKPGDIALGDDDGVFILDGPRAEALLPQLLAKEAQDRERRAGFLQRLASGR
ncbi:RraA family protein [Pseudomonas chlororaphis]|uniref:Putative 4-hydroxy-4-methyl-2-oxoglutarate aldolase n=1 Tax=Pseudomonas chlororaphis TaxID=587753 RepID=A0A0D5XZ59_9PSED|nr:RraA family protein [Pseudomonas chlororaphis]AKA24346.1 S-adenosylmethionine:2-demethylmenaquinone methyltransferase [Pseudomonas chlororaphis]